jgi:hypothetical protein
VKNICIVRHGIGREDVNNRGEAIALGDKLIRLGRLLRNPDLSTLVPKRYFDRVSLSNSAFIGIMHGDNGKQFHVAVLIDQATEDNDFDTVEMVAPK